jgi:hypothetical protein
MRTPMIAAATLLALACEAAPRPRLTASWTGSEASRLRAPASIRWCPRSSRLEVEAVREDAGIAMVLYTVDSLYVGTYEAFDPAVYPMQRPGVAGAARWFTEQEVHGYQSDSGSAELRREGELYTLRFGFRMLSIGMIDTIRLTGRVRGFAPGDCPADTASSLPDPGTFPR